MTSPTSSFVSDCKTHENSKRVPPPQPKKEKKNGRQGGPTSGINNQNNKTKD